jgi:hypothetical protein
MHGMEQPRGNVLNADELKDAKRRPAIWSI